MIHFDTFDELPGYLPESVRTLVRSLLETIGANDSFCAIEWRVDADTRLFLRSIPAGYPHKYLLNIKRNKSAWTI